MNPFDLWLFGFINASSDSPTWLIHGAKAISTYLPSIALLMLAPMILMGPQYRRALIGVIIGMAVAWMAARGIREYVPSSRPFALGIGFQGLEHDVTASFPSMHATVSGAWATSLLLFSPITQRKILAIPVIPIALLTAWSRVFLGLHFPLDIISGLLLGVTSAVLVRHLFDAARKHRKLEAAQRAPTPNTD